MSDADDRVYDGFASFPKGRLDDHLPGCYCYREPAPGPQALCICDRLRACEERVLDDAAGIILTGQTKAWALGYAAGLSAARDAVAALRPITLNSLRRDGSTPSYDVVEVADALAAIDALRGDA